MARKLCEAMSFSGLRSRAAPPGELVPCASIATELGIYGHSLCWLHSRAECNSARLEPVQYSVPGMTQLELPLPMEEFMEELMEDPDKESNK